MIYSLKFLPNPPLPYTGSYELEPDGGWRKMKDGKGGAKWRYFKGGKLSSWLIARPDTGTLSKSEILEMGTKNVHYFDTVEAAVHWYNSYQLRLKNLSLK